MGVFGAFFGCRGDAGFSGPLLGVSSGVVGFNVAMLSCLAREKVRPARAKRVKLGHFLRAGRVLSRTCGEKECAGRVLYRRGAVRVSRCRASAAHGHRGRTRGCHSRAHQVALALVAPAAVGVCSIRSWLAACRRRVVALMTPFPPFGDGSARPPPSAPAAPGVQARSASLARPRPCVLRPERIGLISRNLVLHSRVASAKIVVSTPTWRVIRPPVR